MARTRNMNRQLTDRSIVIRQLGDAYTPQALSIMIDESLKYTKRLISGYTVNDQTDISDQVWAKTVPLIGRLAQR